jgi:hypothetical protein
VTITDAPHHGDASASEYVPPAFVPRRQLEILRSLGGRIVSSIDPALIDAGTELGAFAERDADLFPKYSGGFGGDSKKIKLDIGGITPFEESVSYFDLELLLFARGLLDIPLAPVLASTCVLELPADATPASVAVAMTSSAGNASFKLTPRVVDLP